MSNRRRLLLSYLANSFKYLPYSYEYLYYGLVPTTISGKTVKNKAKVSKLYGNSVVENQLLQPTKPTETQNGITITNNGDGSFTLTGTATATVYFVFLYGTWTDHYYLFKGINYPNNNVRWYDVYYGIYSSNKDFIFRNTNSSYTQLRASIRIESGTDFTNSPFTFFPNLIDLTQSYSFDTPTTLTDNRVQAILNRGYIPYNLGEIKDTDIGEISSEPYNLFDEELAVGFWNGSVGSQISTDNYSSDIRCVNKIKVIGGETYVLEWDNTTYPNLIPYFVETDENGIVLKRANGNTGTFYTREMLSNTKYAYIYFYWINHTFTTPPTDLKCCVHRQGTRTGYAPYEDFTKLANFNPIKINDIQDTFIATDIGYRFTKKTSVVDLGLQNWTYETVASGDNYYTDVISNAKKNSSVFCEKYGSNTNVSPATLRNNAWISASGRINITADGYNGNATEFKNAMEGVPLYYELATYQTISMPLRHLGMIDLGILAWSKNGNNQFYSTSLSNLIKKPTSNNNVANIYCNLYLSKSLSNVFEKESDNIIGIYANDGTILIWDNSKSNMSATDFKTVMSGIYLYYETADVVDETGIITNNGLIPFKYQGSGVGTSHDTYELTKTAHVFTKNISRYTFTGNESWTQWTYERAYTNVIQSLIKLPSGTDISANALLDNYQIYFQSDLTNKDKVFCVATNGNLIFRDTANITNIQSIMAGHTLEYQLATPQIISIPKKHLGIVDLGSLDYVAQGSGRFVSSGLVSTIKPISDNANIGNIYCSEYLSVSYYNISTNMSICVHTSGNIYIQDNSKSNMSATDFKNAMSGILLFYETENEVADITDTFDIQSGGTITTDSNVLPNADFLMKGK